MQAKILQLLHRLQARAARRAPLGGLGLPPVAELKADAGEVVFRAAMVKAGSAPAAGRGASAAPLATAAKASGSGDTIYRHRAEMTITGNFGTLLGYLQTLQRVPGDLHWNRLQLSVAAYPQASIQLTLYTLSSRPETPFN